ncbi:hypothetical protein M153_1410007437 [Pseudoloma neurophilia]|uniref:Uncharacterized protein n=1 Tax=Pseudoloma neurophilia TaxID=146866 RepID=A0A0R0M774_9MICR|nr:hypothetical protein M153_1410007437 [Pseudoloma neurophilia]
MDALNIILKKISPYHKIHFFCGVRLKKQKKRTNTHIAMNKKRMSLRKIPSITENTTTFTKTDSEPRTEQSEKNNDQTVEENQQEDDPSVLKDSPVSHSPVPLIYISEDCRSKS